MSDCISAEEFMTMRGCLKQREKLDEKEKVYYEYTCGMGDVVRMMDIPSPKMTEDDLIAEKDLQG